MTDHQAENNATEPDALSADDIHWMDYAIGLAAQGEVLGEVPVGAVIVADNQIIGEGFNQPISLHDATAHAEIVALRQASAKIQNYRVVGATLYVTLEPCTMCVGALVHARIKRLVFGTTEPKAGAVVSKARLLDNEHFNHRIEYAGGALADKCQHQLSQFFAYRREEKRKQKLAKPES